MKTKILAVYGSARTPQGSVAYREALSLGKRLAEIGHVVVNGGYGGTMEAVSRGAAEAGGRVIGVTCDLFNPRVANAWLSEERRTPDLLARLRTIMSLADGFIALPGGIGTLSEVALTWNMLQAGQLTARPFILLGEPWCELVSAIAQHTEIGSSIVAMARLATDVDETIALLGRWWDAAAEQAAPAAGPEESPPQQVDPSPLPARPPAR
jgi:uncharacterized protein (TIGR00730 family)